MHISKRLLVLVVAIAATNLGSVRGDQPHMTRALQHLQAARTELQRAEHNKAGWRQRALRNVDQAIVDTENGIKAGR